MTVSTVMRSERIQLVFVFLLWYFVHNMYNMEGWAILSVDIDSQENPSGDVDTMLSHC